MSTHSDATAVSPADPGGAIPLLRTKLSVPRTGSRLVARPRLTERLGRGVDGRLTIVSAPAGFGKTTLLAQWLARSPGLEGGAAWVSLESSENDPTLFWSYVVAALQKVHPAIGTGVRPLLEAHGGVSFEPALTVLLNDIDAIEADTVLILDDYHVIEATSVHEGLAFLIDHLPWRMHVVVATRFDPPLPLARLRARGELIELHASDLRFSRPEVSTFSNEIMALDLTESDVMRLESRTEGWITALKLAALAGAGHGGASGEGRAFAGGDGYVADYVIDEVLRAEPEPVRRFLLATSILDRLSGPLCDEVADQRESRRLLADLARRNLFVVALDEDGTWYRYHHLFAEVLRNHGRRVDPELLRTSHGRASRWHERHGSRLDAVDHALEAGDHERAAELLEEEWPEKNRSYQTVRWLRLAKALPNVTFANRPELSMGYAWALLNDGEPEAAEVPLRQVEAWLSTSPRGPGGSVPEERGRSLSVELASARGYLAQMLGDAPGTIEHARRALDLVPEADHAARATGTSLVALALWGSGRLEEAYQTFSDALASMRRAGRPQDAIRGTFVLGDLRVAQGRLREAASIYEAGLSQVAEHEHAAALEADELYLGLAEVHCQWGELDAAEGVLKRLDDARAGATSAGNQQRWLTTVARIRDARHDTDAAVALLEEAETLQVRSPLPQVRPVAAMKARMEITRGKLSKAQAWAEGARLSAEDLSYQREFEHLTLARLLLAESRAGVGERSLADATTLLERLAGAAEHAGRKGSLIEALALLALARHAAGDRRGALDAIARSLELAEVEGYVRVFADERTPMRDLLRQAMARGRPPHTRRGCFPRWSPSPRVPVAPPRPPMHPPASPRAKRSSSACSRRGSATRRSRSTCSSAPRPSSGTSRTST